MISKKAHKKLLQLTKTSILIFVSLWGLEKSLGIFGYPKLWNPYMNPPSVSSNGKHFDRWGAQRSEEFDNRNVILTLGDSMTAEPNTPTANLFTSKFSTLSQRHIANAARGGSSTVESYLLVKHIYREAYNLNHVIYFISCNDIVDLRNAESLQQMETQYIAETDIKNPVAKTLRALFPYIFVQLQKKYGIKLENSFLAVTNAPEFHLACISSLKTGTLLLATTQAQDTIIDNVNKSNFETLLKQRYGDYMWEIFLSVNDQISEHDFLNWLEQMNPDILEQLKDKALHDSIWKLALTYPEYWEHALYDEKAIKNADNTFKDMLSAINQLHKNSSIEYSFVYLPHPLEYDEEFLSKGYESTGIVIPENSLTETSKIRRFLNDFCQEENIPFLDLTTVFKNYRTPSELYESSRADFHFTNKGGDVIAETLFIRKRPGFVPLP